MPKKNLLQANFKPGDWVLVKQEKNEFEGTVLPATQKGFLDLKLSSGYNVSIELNKKTDIKKLGKEITAKKTDADFANQKNTLLSKETRPNPDLPTILILHTGGTIASRVNYETGGVFAAFSPHDLLQMFPELLQKANFETSLIGNMESENMRFAHYTKIAEEIKKNADKKIAGIIISHGTDTLGFTAAALAFMVQHPPFAVLLVGAQRSSDRASSDAAMNLSCAVDFMVHTDFAGVGICMHETENDDFCVVLPATKTRKLHSSRRDAFKPVNAKPIARVEYKTGKTTFLQSDYLKRGHGLPTVFKTKMEEKIGLLKSHPNLMPEMIRIFEKQRFKGLIVEGTGLGHLPIISRSPMEKTNEQNFKALQSLIKKGCLVAMTTQCLYGAVDMNVYSAGRELLKAGVLHGKDLLPETALVKLAWLLGNFSKKEASALFSKNLVGEINERTPIDSVAGDTHEKTI